MKKPLKIVLRVIGILLLLVIAGRIADKILHNLDAQRQANVGLANPASVYCEQQSGTLEIVTDASGAQSGICHLVDGTTCEEWAYMRGECPSTGSVVTGAVENSGGLTNQTPPYQSGQILYIPKVGILFTLPSGWKLTGRDTQEGTDGENIEITTNMKDNGGYAVVVLLSMQMEKDQNGCLISYNPIYDSHGVIQKITCVPSSEITIAKLQEIKQAIKPQILEEYNGVYLFPGPMDNEKDILMAPFDKKYTTEFNLKSTNPNSTSECTNPGGCVDVSATTNTKLYNSIDNMLGTAKAI